MLAQSNVNLLVFSLREFSPSFLFRSVSLVDVLHNDLQYLRVARRPPEQKEHDLKGELTIVQLVPATMSGSPAQQEIAAIDEKHAEDSTQKSSDTQVVAVMDSGDGPSGLVSRSRQSLSDLFTIVSRA